MQTKHMTCKAWTKAVDESARTVEQVVSVFSNVDLSGDRVNFGAFANSLAKWKASPNTMPVYYSHQWDDPFSNIGGVVEAEEVPPGDERLPNDEIVTGDGKTLRDLGGLLVKYQLDPQGVNPKADQVFRLLKARRVVQASFAYDIVKNRLNSDGVQDLDELDILEVGPTPLGANPATRLVASAKAIAAQVGVTEEQAEAVLDAAGVKEMNHTFIPSDDDATKCVLCGKTQRAVAHISRLSNDEGPDGTKSVNFPGSVEERQEAVYGLARQWAMDNDIGNGGFFHVYLEATYPDRAVILVEGWSDPAGEGVYYEASIADNDDGTLSISQPVESVVELTARPKARRKALAYAARTEAATLSGSDTAEGTGPGNGDAGDRAGDRPESKAIGMTPTDVRLQALRFLSP